MSEQRSFLHVFQQIEEQGSARAKELCRLMADAAIRYVALRKYTCNVRELGVEESGVITTNMLRASMCCELCLKYANELRGMRYQLPHLNSMHDFCLLLAREAYPDIDFSLSEPMEVVV